jgi:UDP-N-acetylglucosamine 3-dehydrogenase
MNRWKTVLIGAGKMGKNHLRVLGEDPRFDVVAVVDPRAADMFSAPKFKVAPSLEALGELAWDCAVVAAPTPLHFQIGRDLIQRKKPILMEKPLAATPAECDELVSMIDASGVPVGVGHLERFNPAVRKVSELIRSGWLGRTVHFSFTRVGGYPEGITTGDNVLIDLAVHDLDVLRFLVGPVHVRASVCHSAWRPGVFDTAEILLTADSGESASIHTNWVTPTKIRTLRVTGTRGVCLADYILQSCVMFGGNMLRKLATDEFDFRSLIADYKSSDRVEFGIVKQEPLKVQLEMFHRMLSGRPTEICPPKEAAAAVALANEATRVALRSVHGPQGDVNQASQSPQPLSERP